MIDLIEMTRVSRDTGRLLWLSRKLRLVTYTDELNLSCAYVPEGADWTSKIVLGIGIFRDFSIVTSPEAGSLR